MAQRLNTGNPGAPPDVTLDFAKGEHHTADETRVPPGFARSISNFDVTDTGQLQTRPGFAPLPGVPGGHSMWTAPNGNTYYVSGHTLLRLHGGVAHPVVGEDGNAVVIVASHRRMWYVAQLGDVYFSNGVVTGRIGNDGRVYPWGIANPVVPFADDSAPRTTYVSWVDDRGEESGAVRCDAGYDTLSNFPYVKRLYWSDDGSELLRHNGTGKQCDTVGLVPMPAGRFLTAYAGRLWVAVDDHIFYSQALRYGLCDPGYNFIRAPGVITAFGATLDGLYVSTATEVWFLAGTEPTKMQFDKVSDEAAFEGSQLYIPFTAIDANAFGTSGTQLGMGEALGWLSVHGAVLALPGGIVRVAGAGTVRLPTSPAIMSLLNRDGFKQFVAVVESNGSEGQGAAVDSPVSNI